MISAILYDFLICRPVSFRWKRLAGGGTCGDQKSYDLYIGITNLLLDFVVVILPMPVLWGLQMAVGRKVALSAIFSMGVAYALAFPIASHLFPVSDLFI